ncbi:MAG: molybdopterin-dependent oxidoreductase [Methylomonas sp.]
MNASTINSTCPYCGVGCGIVAKVIDPEQHLVEIQGDANHPANFGRLCSKGSNLADTVSLENRLLYPEIDGQTCDWDSALDQVANGFKTIIDQHGPDAIAFYVSGQLLTEDYYVANKLMKGFIGSANIDTNSRLCMSSAVVGYKRAFGADAVPCSYDDLEQAELIVLIGSNAAWCHPIAFQRIRQAKQNNPLLKIVVIDPRQTASCDIADLHLAIKPGMDALLFNGLLTYLHYQDGLNQSFIDQHCQGFESALRSAINDAADLSELAKNCGLDEHDLQQFYRWFADIDKVVSVYSQGINQSSSGSDKCNAIINCHLATGKIGQAGMGPFSFTGQPNAMGGREVGGLANMLAAHMALENPVHRDLVGRFWGSDNIAKHGGLKAVELFEAVEKGQVKALWIMGTNPVVSMPNADQVKRALQHCELLVVSDCINNTDTLSLAKIKLPATGWSEKDGTVTNLERRISRQRALFKPAGNAKPDWWIISQVAQRMGFKSGFEYQSSAEIFAEHAALSGFENTANQQARDFDISKFADISASDFAELQPIQWPVNATNPNGTARLFANHQFYTDTGKAQLIAVKARPPSNPLSRAYPFTLNTGRIRDQWHTMTRTGLAHKLNSHKPEPQLEIHPADAKDLGLVQNSLAKLESRWGSMLARIDIQSGQQPGSVFVPMHWTAELSSHGRVGALVNPVVDPLSGQPESKQTPVKISAWPTKWQALIVSRQALEDLGCEYWVKNKGDGVWRYFLAGQQTAPNLAAWRLNDQQADIAYYQDSASGDYRYASFKHQRLDFCLFVSSKGDLPELNWLSSLFAEQQLSRQQRLNLLSGRPSKDDVDCGRTVCACFNVGEKTICEAIKSHQITTITEIGNHLSAGTGCGSCIPELKGLLSV